MTDERRRVDDTRIDELVDEMKSTRKEVRDIREMLISEPEASPLGRQLLRYAAENRSTIAKHHDEFLAFKKEEFDPLEDWRVKFSGVWMAIAGLGTVLGIVGAFFGLAAYFGLGSPN